MNKKEISAKITILNHVKCMLEERVRDNAIKTGGDIELMDAAAYGLITAMIDEFADQLK